MSFQTPNPNAPGNDPAAWVTTGTPVPGGSDPKTLEMLAAIRRLHLEYDPTDQGNTATVGPKYANYLLLPDGTVTPDLSIAQFDPAMQWAADAYAQQLAEKRFLILYWGPRMPTQTVHATDDNLATQEIYALAASPGANTGRVTTVTADVQAARDAQTAAATTTQPTVPVLPPPGISGPIRPDSSLPTLGVDAPVLTVAGTNPTATAGAAQSQATASGGGSAPPSPASALTALKGALIVGGLLFLVLLYNARKGR